MAISDSLIELLTTAISRVVIKFLMKLIIKKIKSFLLWYLSFIVVDIAFVGILYYLALESIFLLGFGIGFAITAFLVCLAYYFESAVLELFRDRISGWIELTEFSNVDVIKKLLEMEIEDFDFYKKVKSGGGFGIDIGITLFVPTVVSGLTLLIKEEVPVIGTLLIVAVAMISVLLLIFLRTWNRMSRIKDYLQIRPKLYQRIKVYDRKLPPPSMATKK